MSISCHRQNFFSSQLKSRWRCSTKKTRAYRSIRISKIFDDDEQATIVTQLQDQMFFSLIKNISILFPIIRCRPALQVTTALFIRVTDFFSIFRSFFL